VTVVGLALLTGGLLAVALAYVVTLLGVADAAAPVALALGTVAVLAGLGLLGATRRGRPTPILLGAIGGTAASVLAGFLLPLVMPPPPADAPLLFGLPRPTALLVGLVFLVPLVVLPVAYALAFPREVWRPEDADGGGPAR